MIPGNWRIFLVGLFLLSSVAYCFTSDEAEIFKIQQEITKRYGVDFYKFLELPRLKDSTSKEITKNFRKLSKKYHPDKNKKYRKRYERLNLVSKILSDDSRRKTYDYYLKNGFPAYDFNKGGFFFSRPQPKVWFILAFIYVSCGLIHLILLRLQNNGNKTRIRGFLRQVKSQDDTNGLGEKHLLLKQSDNDEGKEIVIKLGDVYVVQPDGTEAQISLDDIKDPGFKDCLLATLPAWLWNISLGRLFVQTSEKSELEHPKKKTDPSKKVLKPKGAEKMELPNGKVVYSRKRKN